MRLSKWFSKAEKEAKRLAARYEYNAKTDTLLLDGKVVAARPYDPFVESLFRDLLAELKVVKKKT